MFTRVRWALLGVFVVATLVPVNPSPPVFTRPNVLIIVTDDQRVDQMRVLPRTNGLFKSGGVTFSNAYAATPLCCPSRASIFSGQYAHNHGVHGNTIPDVDHLDLSHTLQKALHVAGYQTGIAGKFFNGWDLNRDPPDFDRWAIMKGGYTNTTFNLQGRVTADTGYSTDFVSNQAKSMLDQFQSTANTGKPWFLYVAPFAPHFPYTANPADIRADVGSMVDHPSLHESDTRDKPPWISRYSAPDLGRTPSQVWQLQARALLQVDRLVQRLFDNTKDAQDTLAIFVSDNGYLLGEHGISEDTRLPYAESARVPMLLRWPRRLSGHSTNTRPVMNLDITATVAQAARLPATNLPLLDGRSLLSAYRRSTVFLEGFATKENPKDPGFPAWSSIIRNGFQYTEWTGPKGNLAFRELYNEASDSAQTTNLFWRAPGAAGRIAAPYAGDLASLRSCRGIRGTNPCP